MTEIGVDISYSTAVVEIPPTDLDASRCIAILHRPSQRKSAAEPAASSSHRTLRWREPDSNHRYRSYERVSR
jgi:hypothetical protein